MIVEHHRLPRSIWKRWRATPSGEPAAEAVNAPAKALYERWRPWSVASVPAWPCAYHAARYGDGRRQLTQEARQRGVPITMAYPSTFAS